MRIPRRHRAGNIPNDMYSILDTYSTLERRAKGKGLFLLDKIDDWPGNILLSSRVQR